MGSERQAASDAAAESAYRKEECMKFSRLIAAALCLAAAPLFAAGSKEAPALRPVP
jgi:hypothetical protein